jgi:hypothetical protein
MIQHGVAVGRAKRREIDRQTDKQTCRVNRQMRKQYYRQANRETAMTQWHGVSGYGNRGRGRWGWRGNEKVDNRSICEVVAKSLRRKTTAIAP